MAERRGQPALVKLSCPICQDLLKDPVTVPCGHSYCSHCINSHWDENEVLYSCPLCRETFVPRPMLKKNILLAEVVEELKRAEVQAAAADVSHGELEYMACDLCIGRKMRAVKYCLVCSVTFCEEHLRLHGDCRAFDRHKLVEPSRKHRENICLTHNEEMNIFCRTDQRSICYLCIMDQHRGHVTVPTLTERNEKQKELEASRLKIRKKIQERQRDVKLLQKLMVAINLATDQAVENIYLIQKRSCDLRMQLRTQQHNSVSRIRKYEEKLDKDIAQLKRNGVHLERLARTEDHNKFLHRFHFVSTLREPTNSFSMHSALLKYFSDVAGAMSECRQKLYYILSETWPKVSASEAEEELQLLQARPPSREDI